MQFVTPYFCFGLGFATKSKSTPLRHALAGVERRHQANKFNDRSSSCANPKPQGCVDFNNIAMAPVSDCFVFVLLLWQMQ